MFFVFLLISMLLTMLINNVFQMPVLNIVNRITGLVAGLLCGLVVVFIISLIASWGFPLIDASLDSELTGMFVSKSSIIRFLNSFNPFGALLG